MTLSPPSDSLDLLFTQCVKKNNIKIIVLFLFSARRSISELLSALRPRRTSRQQTGNLVVNSQTHLTQSRYPSRYKTLSQRLQNKRYITWNSNSVGSNQDGQMAANFTTVGHPSQLVDY